MSVSTATSNLPAIEMRGAAAGIMTDPGSVAVEEINWSVASGDFWVVAGLQGSGKSDFLMMTGGLVAPVQGTYHFFGEEMPIFEDAKLAERLRLGFVFDGGQLFNHLTVLENVALPLRYHRNLSDSEAEAEVPFAARQIWTRWPAIPARQAGLLWWGYVCAGEWTGASAWRPAA